MSIAHDDFFKLWKILPFLTSFLCLGIFIVELLHQIGLVLDEEVIEVVFFGGPLPTLVSLLVLGLTGYLLIFLCLIRLATQLILGLLPGQLLFTLLQNFLHFLLGVHADIYRNFLLLLLRLFACFVVGVLRILQSLDLLANTLFLASSDRLIQQIL